MPFAFYLHFNVTKLFPLSGRFMLLIGLFLSTRLVWVRLGAFKSLNQILRGVESWPECDNQLSTSASNFTGLTGPILNQVRFLPVRKTHYHLTHTLNADLIFHPKWGIFTLKWDYYLSDLLRPNHLLEKYL